MKAAASRGKRERGERLGTIPLGFRRGQAAGALEPAAEELTWVRLILRCRRAGASFASIAAELTRLGARTKRGGRWYASTVRAIWTRRAEYRGLPAA